MRFVRFALLLALFALAACGSPTNSSSGASSAANNQPLSASSAPAASGAVGDPVERDGKYAEAPAMTIDPNKQYTATIETTKGTMTFELLPKEAPLAVNNFVFLARENFYQNVRFHRIIKGFMIQGGDPTGTGRGGPGYTFAEEPVTRDYTRGTLAMARTPAPNSQGSQFFIVHQDSGLPKEYTIFGQLTDGEDVLDAIANTPVQFNPQTGEQSQPTEDVRILNVTINEQ